MLRSGAQHRVSKHEWDSASVAAMDIYLLEAVTNGILLGGLLAYWVLMRGERSVIGEERFDAITRGERPVQEPAPTLLPTEARP